VKQILSLDAFYGFLAMSPLGGRAWLETEPSRPGRKSSWNCDLLVKLPPQGESFAVGGDVPARARRPVSRADWCNAVPNRS
jgi:hypothetical protein